MPVRFVDPLPNESRPVESKVLDFILNFTSLLWEAMPFIVLGAVIAGVVEEFVPQSLITRLLPRNRTLAIALSGFLGLLFPMCECGIIPVMRRLLRKRLPLSCAVCYLLAGPIINVVVITSTAVAFYIRDDVRQFHQMGSSWMVGMRLGLGWLVAFGTSLIVEQQFQRQGNALLAASSTPEALDKTADPDDDQPGQRRPAFRRLSNISETALHDFVDIMVYLTIGALLASLARQILSHQEIDELSRSYPYLSILIMMGIAVVLCICSEADAFVAASFTTLAPASKLAFLVLGPMLDFKLFFMYTRVFRPRLIRTIIVSVVIQVFVYAGLTHLAWESGLLEGIAARLGALFVR